MKRVLVTGANGQLGMTLKELALNYRTLKFDFKGFKALNIINRETLHQVFNKSNYDYCINCAAYTNVEQAEKEPQKAILVNVEGVKNLASVCKKHDTILVHISTDYVFDGEKGSPYLPDDMPNPINKYGKSKLMGEKIVQEILEEYYIVRTSWLYSKNFGKNFYRTILEKAMKGEVLRVTKEQKGCPTSTKSFSKFLVERIILENAKFGIHHFCDGEVMTWFEFAKKILQENNLYNKVSLEVSSTQNTNAKRPKYSVLN